MEFQCSVILKIEKRFGFDVLYLNFGIETKIQTLFLIIEKNKKNKKNYTKWHFRYTDSTQQAVERVIRLILKIRKLSMTHDYQLKIKKELIACPIIIIVIQFFL